jgi:GH15 family glucan-1,4-alpha-glucosidase
MKLNFGALRRLGHFEERESFLNYLLGIASSEDVKLQPLYRVDGSTDLEEKILTNWAGFEGHGPVRIGNGAALHTQNDIFGEMVLALVPIFMDERFSAERSRGAFELLERLAHKAVAVAGQPDAGIWELRTEWVPQTFSSLMSWAAADRMARVAAELGIPEGTVPEESEQDLFIHLRCSTCGKEKLLMQSPTEGE